MAIREIDFKKIRPHRDSRNGGFEELCCQLAALEAPANAAFHRKGPGADAGVECFYCLPNGNEIAWQAKYFFEFGTVQISQLDESIETALNKHPNLTKYIVCIPIDLKDARRSTAQKSQLQKWDEWVKKWRDHAKRKKRNLTIEKWGYSDIAERLGRDTPLYSGRSAYWFDEQILTGEWFKHHFNKAKKSLGSRYTPETNVEIPFRQSLLYFARDPKILKQVTRWIEKVNDDAATAIRQVPKDSNGKTPKKCHSLNGAVEDFLSALRSAPTTPDLDIPIADWIDRAKAAHKAANECFEWTWSLPRKSTAGKPDDEVRHAQYFLQKLTSLIDEIILDLESPKWSVVNTRSLLIYGDAGVGKSHTLADAVEYQIEHNRPALLFLGSQFNKGPIWPQIVRLVDYPTTLQLRHFLGSLDAAAQAVDTRAVIFIDGINERDGVEIWPDALSDFIEEISAYPRISVAISCRTTFIDGVIPDSLPPSRLPRLEHTGFSGHAAAAASAYLNKRGIVRPGAPNLVPEFENPLFLKTCCDFLEKEGLREFPKGLRGLNAVFEFYIRAVTNQMNSKMRLDRHQNIPQNAITYIANSCAAANSNYIPKKQIADGLETILASNGLAERSLLVQLEREGLVTIEPIREEDGTLSEYVHFTFERFSDYFIAKSMLDKHLDRRRPAKSFKKGAPLFEYVTDISSYRNQGVLEALAILLPEQIGVEILDAFDDEDSRWKLSQAFKSSLLLRQQNHFTKRTLTLVSENYAENELIDTLISISTEPDNEFNAKHLHKILMKKTMSERDRAWSTHLARYGSEEFGAVETIISWVFEGDINSVADDRAELTAIVLSWFFTTSNREIRDRATKSLARLLSTRLPLAEKLIKLFSSVDDPYVYERVLAAAYGAALQGLTTTGLKNLSKTVFDFLFAKDHPPPQILIRDYGRGILEYTAWRGLLPKKVDITRARPPYQSAWPIEYVSSDEVESFKEEYRNGYVSTDRIVGSTIHDGDFARYVIDPAIHDWSSTSIGCDTLSNVNDIYSAWFNHFQEIGTVTQLEAFSALLEVNKKHSEGSFRFDSPEQKERDAAEQKFKEALGPIEWERYEIEAQHYVNSRTRYGRTYDGIAAFDARWARRWVCKRAHDFGWKPELFSSFDNRFGSSDRNNHRIERIGKKYQWLALHELTARMADNLAFISDRYKQRKGHYDGPWQPHLRNIDPSLLVQGTHYDGWQQWEKTWWVPFEPKLPILSPVELLTWLYSDKDVINDSSLIDVTDPKTGRRWLTLDGFSSWNQYNGGEHSRYIERDTWFRLNCVIVEKALAKKLLKDLAGHRLTDPHALPEYEFSGGYQFLGEYPWHPAFSDLTEVTEPDSWRGLSVPTRASIAKYRCEKSGYDYSLEHSVGLIVPSPWLMKALGLRLSCGRTLNYVDATGATLFFDPCVSRPGPGAGLVDRDAFIAALEREGLTAFWVIAGEKNVYGDPHGINDRGYGGSIFHSYIYELKDEGFVCKKFIEVKRPSANQLEAFLGRKPSKSLLEKLQIEERGGKRSKPSRNS